MLKGLLACRAVWLLISTALLFLVVVAAAVGWRMSCRIIVVRCWRFRVMVDHRRRRRVLVARGSSVMWLLLIADRRSAAAGISGCRVDFLPLCLSLLAVTPFHPPVLEPYLYLRVYMDERVKSIVLEIV